MSGGRAHPEFKALLPGPEDSGPGRGTRLAVAAVGVVLVVIAVVALFSSAR